MFITAAIDITAVIDNSSGCCLLQFFNTCIYTHDKNLLNPEMTFWVKFKVIDEKMFYDRGDLENMVKVKLTTCNKRFCQNASWV